MGTATRTVILMDMATRTVILMGIAIGMRIVVITYTAMIITTTTIMTESHQQVPITTMPMDTIARICTVYSCTS